MRTYVCTTEQAPQSNMALLTWYTASKKAKSTGPLSRTGAAAQCLWRRLNGWPHFSHCLSISSANLPIRMNQGRWTSEVKVWCLHKWKVHFSVRQNNHNINNCDMWPGELSYRHKILYCNYHWKQLSANIVSIQCFGHTMYSQCELM